MKPGGGKQKGSQFERDVCHRLSLYVSGGKSVDLFWRSAMSGGRATVRNKTKIDVRQSGDICAVAPEGHDFTDKWYIECKSYKNLQIDRFIVLGQGQLMKFWRETKKQARKYHKRPMLIAKQNGFPPLVIIASHAFAFRLPLVSCQGVTMYLLDEALGVHDGCKR